MLSPMESRLISIGDFLVKLRFAELRSNGARHLMRGDDEVHLSPKAFELLMALVERRPNAVSEEGTSRICSGRRRSSPNRIRRRSSTR